MLSARVNLTHQCLLPGQGLAEGRRSLTVAWELPGVGEILGSLLELAYKAVVRCLSSLRFNDNSTP